MATPLPDLESIRCFVAAATHSSFRAAANFVGLSPAAFSERMQRLEDEMGAPLLLRGRRAVQLTPAGARLLPHAQRLLDDARACRVHVQEDRPSPYTLTIGTRFELGLSWILPALADLEAREPHRTIHLVFGATEDLLAALADGRVDAIVGSMRLTHTSMNYALLHEETYQLVASPALLKHTPLREPQDAAHHQLIDTGADLPLFRYWLDAQPPEESWLFRRYSYLGTIAAMKARVVEGAGVAVLPSYFLTNELADGTLVDVGRGAPPRSDWFRLIWRDKHPHGRDLERLGSELRARPLT